MELFGLLLFIGFFVITFKPIASFIDKNFPSKSKTKVGLLGVLPTKVAWAMMVWLAICILLAGGLVGKKDKSQPMDKEDAEMMETLDYEENE